MHIYVQEEDFSQDALLRDIGKSSQTGAIVSFIGKVRDDTNTLHQLEIEHYPMMCKQALRAMAEDVKKRFLLEDVLIVHRFGKLNVGENIMMVATASSHRQAAFDGANFLMDYLKSNAPFWKKESFLDGTSKWVEPKESDAHAMTRW